MKPTALAALHHGAAYLVDEHGHRLPGTAEDQLAWPGVCWAHLRDGATGQWHVHELHTAAALDNPHILEMLLPFPPQQSNA